ncbi:MAG: hypothetical protein NTV68_00225 [Methanomicrobiales archaeon]|nr:hypothetical protein [Methanomicrobiales archaeon]
MNWDWSPLFVARSVLPDDDVPEGLFAVVCTAADAVLPLDPEELLPEFDVHPAIITPVTRIADATNMSMLLFFIFFIDTFPEMSR